MKGIREVYLHPDNLKGGTKYRVTYRTIQSPDVNIIKEGKFIKMDLLIATGNCEDTKGSNTLLVSFLFTDGTLALAWKRVVSIQELTISSRKSPKDE